MPPFFVEAYIQERRQYFLKQARQYNLARSAMSFKRNQDEITRRGVIWIGSFLIWTGEWLKQKGQLTVEISSAENGCETC